MPVRKAHPQRKKDPSAFTEKERRVIELQNEGRDALEIAAALGVDLNNIKRCFKLIAEKRECQEI